MKEIFYILLTILCFTCPAICGNGTPAEVIVDNDNWIDTGISIEEYVPGINGYELTFSKKYKIELVKQWAKDGTICKIYGHQWESITQLWVLSTDGEYPDEKRQCNICDKTQTKQKNLSGLM